jgi:hypothetical protein
VRGCRKVFGKSIGKVLPEVDFVFGRVAECGVEEQPREGRVSIAA